MSVLPALAPRRRRAAPLPPAERRADIINAGTGNDAVDYWGSEVSIDGGGGTNTLVVRASATLDLSASDQSAGDLSSRASGAL